MDKPAYLVDRDSTEEFDLLKAAYAHDHEPIPFKQHQAVLEELRFESLMRDNLSGCFVDLQIVDGSPPRFFLTGWNPTSPGPRQVYASKGFWHRNREAREHISEFAKALAAMLVLLSPMLLPGGGL